MPGFSPTMSLKGDPDMHVLKVLKKHGMSDLMREVSRWLDSEPNSPGALKKHYIESQTGVDYYSIDLKDPTTWGDGIENMPSDEFFLELHRAVQADIKRATKRSSYEF